MSKVSIVDTEPPITLLSNSDAVADALAALGATIQVHHAYQELLRLRFALVVHPDRKEAQKFQKVLMGQPALQVLMVIWKESPCVSDEAIESAFVQREFAADDPLNCHSLAIRLAEEPSDLERQQKRVQNVVAAGEIYGYIARDSHCHSRTRPVRGTEALHELMVRLGSHTRSIMSRALDYELGPLR